MLTATVPSLPLIWQSELASGLNWTREQIQLPTTSIPSFPTYSSNSPDSRLSDSPIQEMEAKVHLLVAEESTDFVSLSPIFSGS
jgi:hypothetical protein